MPIIGIEPALKPAVEYKRNGSILIMATPMTLSESKFNNLMKNYKDEAEIRPLPCPGLVELIESGKIDDRDIYEYLENKVRPFQDNGIAAIVLGCTHYPFIRKALSKIVSAGVPIVDGSKGTVRQLQRQLSEYNILNRRQQGGKVEINNSLGTEEIINLSYKLLRLEEY
jgi:glutamate racemase